MLVRDRNLALGGLLFFFLLSLGACQNAKVITPVPSHPAKTGPIQSTNPNAPITSP